MSKSKTAVINNTTSVIRGSVINGSFLPIYLLTVIFALSNAVNAAFNFTY